MKPIKAFRYTLLLALFTLSSALSAVELPNPEMMGSDAKKHHLKDFFKKGKWTTIVVWGPKCPACIEEMPAISSLYDDREKTNIEVLGLAVDYPSFSLGKLKQVQQFEEDYIIDFPNLLISSSSYYELGLGPLKGTPTIILVNPKGEVSAVQLGGVPKDVIVKYIKEQNAKNNLLSKNKTP